MWQLRSVHLEAQRNIIHFIHLCIAVVLRENCEIENDIENDFSDKH